MHMHITSVPYCINSQHPRLDMVGKINLWLQTEHGSQNTDRRKTWLMSTVDWSCQQDQSTHHVDQRNL